MSTSLSLVAIQKIFAGGVRAVDDISLEVMPGEFVTLLGPSGSGKTTLLKIIAGFEDPTNGDILLDSISVRRLPSYRREIGMVFQNYALFPHMTVQDNVAFPLSVRGVTRSQVQAKCAEALALVRLDGLEARFPSQLSGGQQQRVALARAVVFNPRILLMDEPLGALDKKLREQMKIEIMRIQKELEMTVVYVTHDQDEALTMSDRIAVMRHGKLVQVDHAVELYNRPVSRFVAEFIGESNFLPCDAVHGRQFRGKSAGWIMIRPERISIRPLSAREDDAVLEGEITEVQFLGESTRYQVTATGLSLIVKSQNHDETRFQRGMRVALSWNPEHAIELE